MIETKNEISQTENGTGDEYIKMLCTSDKKELNTSR